MIRCKAISQFTLGRFNELKNLKRKGAEVPGTLFVGDEFECEKDLADYLNSGNAKGKTVVQILEIIPEVEETKEEIATAGYCEVIEEKPIKKSKKKKK